MVQTFRKLATLGATQLGSCFMYDDVDSYGVLFDCDGVSMHADQADNQLGVGSMLPAPVYTEPVVTRSMMPESYSAMCSTEIPRFRVSDS